MRRWQRRSGGNTRPRWRHRSPDLRWLHHDSHVLIQTADTTKQALQREPVNAPAQESGYVGLLEAQQGRRPGLGKLTALDDVANFAHQLGLELFFLGVFEAEVGKHIPAAACRFRRR